MRERKPLSQRAQEQGVRAEALCSGSVLAIATARSKQAEHIVLRCVAANRNSVKFGFIAERFLAKFDRPPLIAAQLTNLNAGKINFCIGILATLATAP